MSDTEESCLVGVQLATDGYISQNYSQCNSTKVIIGTVLCPDLLIKCDEFRQLLAEKLPSVPPVFRFLSGNGWPVEKSQESCVKILHLVHCNLITIQKCFDVPRLGVKWNDGTAIGFIFINYNCYLYEVRKKIHLDLEEKLAQSESEFEFLDKNSWPVSVKHESRLSVWDICNENFCIITRVSGKRKMDILNSKPKKRPTKLVSKQTPKRQSFDIKPNSILISYVHCEAMLHARKLKDELRVLGVNSVFLDIDDILPGRDWQDVINDALNNCTAFVALVTPRYGETKWTNREAKLADDKEKLIIPVSFLDKWPPDQLAIQFLSLQYISWKTVDETATAEDGDFSNDINIWDQRCIHRVAKEIKKICSGLDISTPDSVVDETKHQSNGPVQFITSSKKKCVVISAHSSQKIFIEKIANMLDKCEFCVWSSVEMSDFKGEIDFYCEDSQISEASPIFDSYPHEKSFPGSISSKHNYNFFSDEKSSVKNIDFEYLKEMKFHFKNKVKSANLVIIVMSEEYISSTICLQQAYYCEQRREVFVIKYQEFLSESSENLILNLYPEQDMFKFLGTEDEEVFLMNLKKEISKTLNENASKECYKDCIQSKVAQLSRELNIESCIYVIGGTSGVSTTAEQFCFFVGAELAKVSHLTLVTEGFFGAGDLVGKSFCEEREIRDKGKPNTTYHILPLKDNVTSRARQNDNGYFEKIPYGQSLIYGDSISQRDDIVSSTFKICLLIEGGERTACLAKKFLWNDCILIPVIFKNGAIASRQFLNESLKKVPCGVNPDDWSSLSSNNAPEVLAKTVKKIVVTLLKTRKMPKISNGNN